MPDLLRSPLHDNHVALGAKMADFGGWEMPIEYAGAGVLKEHAATREAVGIFDVSHLGKALVTGTGALLAASCADSSVPLISPDRWTARISSTPSSASRRKSAENAAGAGRDVLTAVFEARAAAISSGVVPGSPSSSSSLPITTRSGTTTIPC